MSELTLKAWRIGKGWTQKELADHMGTTVVQVSRWENGRRTPRRMAVNALARLGCPEGVLTPWR